MVWLFWRLRLVATCAAAAFATTFALVPSADAQWLLPFGAAPPAEIVNRLRAEGYVLARPLERRDTVYLADVVRGPHGRERLVIDAWSGEISSGFSLAAEGFAPEGGEYSEPPPLGPPPAGDFREGDFGYGPPGGSEAPPPKAKPRQRPAATARKGGGGQTGAGSRASGRTTERGARNSEHPDGRRACRRRSGQPDGDATTEAGGFAPERRCRAIK